MHGDGILVHQDGRVYTGGFKDDKKHGTGTYKWPKGQMYEG